MDFKIYHNECVSLKNMVVLRITIEDKDLETVNKKVEELFQKFVLENSILNYGALFRAIHSIEKNEIGVKVDIEAMLALENYIDVGSPFYITKELIIDKAIKIEFKGTEKESLNLSKAVDDYIIENGLKTTSPFYTLANNSNNGQLCIMSFAKLI